MKFKKIIYIFFYFVFCIKGGQFSEFLDEFDEKLLNEIEERYSADSSLLLFDAIDIVDYESVLELLKDEDIDLRKEKNGLTALMFAKQKMNSDKKNHELKLICQILENPGKNLEKQDVCTL